MDLNLIQQQRNYRQLTTLWQWMAGLFNNFQPDILQVLGQPDVVGFLERLNGNLQVLNAGNAKIPVILPPMTPCDEVPVERIKSQPDRFHLPFTDFILRI